jgi:hypothetical protein
MKRIQGVEYRGGRGEAPRARCFPQGDEREVESNDRCGEASACCVVMMAATRQPMSGPDPVFFFTPLGGV